MSKPQRKEAVIRFILAGDGYLYTRPFDVSGVTTSPDGKHRHLVSGGMAFKIQETLPEVFRKLGWEQSV